MIGRIKQYKEPCLFVLTGVVNTVFGYGIFAALIFFGLNYVVAALLATCLGIIFNFYTIGGIVFKNKNRALIVRFAGIYGVQYLCNIALMKLFFLVGLNAYSAGAVTLIIIATTSYFLNKYLVFKRKL